MFLTFTFVQVLSVNSSGDVASTIGYDAVKLERYSYLWNAEFKRAFLSVNGGT